MSRMTSLQHAIAMIETCRSPRQVGSPEADQNCICTYLDLLEASRSLLEAPQGCVPTSCTIRELLCWNLKFHISLAACQRLETLRDPNWRLKKQRLLCTSEVDKDDRWGWWSTAISNLLSPWLTVSLEHAHHSNVSRWFSNIVENWLKIAVSSVNDVKHSFMQLILAMCRKEIWHTPLCGQSLFRPWDDRC